MALTYKNDNTTNTAKDNRSWADMFQLSIERARKSINCLTLAFFKEIIMEYDEEKGYGIAEFLPFPLAEEQTILAIEAYFFNSETADKLSNGGQKYWCIGFTDRDYRDNLTYEEPVKTKNKNLHSLSFGIILDVM